jgi:hypothetical protein
MCKIIGDRGEGRDGEINIWNIKIYNKKNIPLSLLSPHLPFLHMKIWIDSFIF